jgi:DNA-binding transcriptional LysR family regulator
LHPNKLQYSAKDALCLFIGDNRGNPMDKFESLRAFVQVVESGGFAAAARQLALSRSAVNKLVLNLEDDLKVQLLHRTTRKVTPTPTGLAFYERCVGILADLAEAELAAAQMHTEPKGQLRVNAPMSFGTLHLAPAIAEFLQQYPDLQIELSLSDRFINPIDEGFDITIRIAQPPNSPSLIVHELCPAPVLLYAAPAYLARHGTPQHPQDLAAHACLPYGHLASAHQWVIVGSGEEYKVNVNGPLCSNNGEPLREAAIQGLGITLLPAFLIDADVRAGRLQHVLASYAAPPISVCILYPVNRHLSTKVRLLTDFLKSRFGQRGFDYPGAMGI